MAHSSKRRASAKSPHRDFPLTLRRSDGRWCKKVKGRIYYFGNAKDDPEGQKAVALWLDQKDDIFAGRTPRKPGEEAPPGVVTVDEVCNRWLEHKNELLEAGELAKRTFERYCTAAANVIEVFGRARAVESLTPDDFRRLRSHLARRYGPVALKNELGMVRSIFAFAVEERIIDKPVFTGKAFENPKAKTLRQARMAAGPRLFTPEQLQALLKHATPNMKAMILLGINGGLGNTDLALLPLKAIDLAGGWLDYPRAKTAIPRRIPLWVETIEAIHEVLAARHEPKEAQHAGLLFIGRRGESYVGNHRGYRVDQEFRRVAKAAGIEGRTFYDLRRTFQTIGEGARDLSAVQAIMGHAASAGDMSAIYRQTVADDRLLAVVEHVRGWLFGKEAGYEN